MTPASRSSLSTQIMVVERVLLETWDKRMRASRAGLIEDLRMALGEFGTNVEQAGTGDASGHAPSPNG